MKGIFTFLTGVLVGATGIFVYFSLGSPKPEAVIAARSAVVAPALPCIPTASVSVPVPSGIKTPTSEPASQPPLARPAAVVAVSEPESQAVVPVENQLHIPVAGVHANALKDMFNDSRGTERRHEAIDILAPKGTEVFAVADGKIAKLFTSKPGGLTVYQFDSSEKLAYYYAHLDRYAADLKEGMMLKRGDLVGYVGISGNADPKTPHLHFAIFELGPEKQWWKGRPVNPYALLGGVARH